MERGCYGLHRVLRQGDPCLIGRGHQGHDRECAAPRHGPGTLEHRVNRVEQGPMPMVREDAPPAFDRIVLAVIRRRVRQPDCERRLRYDGAEPRHTLGAPAVMRGAIIQMEHQGWEVGEALVDGLPPLGEAIDEAIPGHCGPDTLHTQLAHGGQEDAHGRARRLRGKIVVGGMPLPAVLPAAGAWANGDGGCGIHGEAQDVVRGLSGLLDLVHLGEEGVRCGILGGG